VYTPQKAVEKQSVAPINTTARAFRELFENSKPDMT
jgi:hypothetical protein